jgi:hypothetical protein
MNINDLYLIVGYFSRELGSGMYGPDRFNEYCQLVNLKYYKKYLGIPEEWAVGQPMSKIQYQISQGVSDRIDAFIVPEYQISRAISGFFPKPQDYVAFSSLRFRYTYEENCETKSYEDRVEMVPDAEFTDRLGSFLIPPTVRRPVGTWTQYGYRVEPKEINTVLLTYLRMPATPVRLYTSTDQYIPTGSVQFEFPQICWQDILGQLLEAAGISVQDEQVIEYARKIMEKGQ